MKTNFVTTLVLVSALFLSFGIFASPGRADVVNSLFGISASYQNVFFGDYYGRNGDIEGHAAIKGNVDVQAYSFGSGEQNLHPNSQSPTLVVGGNVKASSTSVFDGDAYISGTLTPQAGQNKWNMLGTLGTGPYNTVDPGYRGTAGTVYVNGTQDANLDPTYQKHLASTDSKFVSFDFALAEAQMRKVSADLFGFSDTVSYTSIGTTGDFRIDLTGATGLQVVTIDALLFNSLGSSKSIWIDAGADTTLLINVSNITALDILNLNRAFVINGSSEPGYGDFDGSNILINTDMSQVNIYNTALNASLIALDALIDVRYGNIDGQAFGGSAWTQNGGEFHAYYTFDDRHFVGGGDAVPEPATCLIVALGLAGLGYTQRRQLMSIKTG